MNPRFTYRPADPRDVEAGAVIIENDIPIARTFHLPGWEASDHDDAAEAIIAELSLAWDVPVPLRRTIRNHTNERTDMRKLVAGKYQHVDGPAKPPAVNVTINTDAPPAPATQNAEPARRTRARKKPAPAASAKGKKVSRETQKKASVKNSDARKKKAVKKAPAKTPAKKTKGRK